MIKVPLSQKLRVHFTIQSERYTAGDYRLSVVTAAKYLPAKCVVEQTGLVVRVSRICSVGSILVFCSLNLAGGVNHCGYR